jgi:hypothetical protein
MGQADASGGHAQTASGAAIHTERGVALIAAMAAVLLMSVVTAGLVLITSSERGIAASYRNSVEALYAAEAIAERVVGELQAVSDWQPLLDGLVTSSFVDGPPTGTRRLRNGGTLDLTQVLGDANNNRPSSDKLAWHLFAYGPLDGVLPGMDSPFYVLVMIAAGPAVGVNDPAASSDERAPGSGLVLLRSEAFGLREAHRVIQLAVMRSRSSEDGRDGQDEQQAGDGQGGWERRGVSSVRVVSWREVL